MSTTYSRQAAVRIIFDVVACAATAAQLLLLFGRCGAHVEHK
jgi:hypothetical protein